MMTYRELDMSEEIMQYCVVLMLSEGNECSTVVAAVLECATSWMSARLLPLSALAQTRQATADDSAMSILEIICHRGVRLGMLHVNVLSAMADFLDELLVVATDPGGGGGSGVPVSCGDHRAPQDAYATLDDAPFTDCVLPPHFMAELSDVLNAVLAANGEVFSEDGSAQSGALSVNCRHSYCRVLAASMKFTLHNSPNPFIDVASDEAGASSSGRGLAVLAVAQQLCRAANCGSIGAAAVAMEVYSPPPAVIPILSY
jgi:hypothetical protein